MQVTKAQELLGSLVGRKNRQRRYSRGLCRLAIRSGCCACYQATNSSSAASTRWVVGMTASNRFLCAGEGTSAIATL